MARTSEVSMLRDALVLLLCWMDFLPERARILRRKS